MKKLLNLFVGLLLLASSPAIAQERIKIDMATAPPGAAWYVGFGAYAKVITEMYPEMDTMLFPGGGIANIIRVDMGRSQLGLTALPFMKLAVEGTEPYKKKLNVKALANLNDKAVMYVCSPEGSKVTSLRQMIDEKMPVRISLGSKVGGNGELYTRWLLQEYGWSKADITKNGGQHYGTTTPETVSMLQEGQLDLDIWTGPGVPHRYQEVIRNKKLNFLDIDQDIIDAMVEKYGFIQTTIPVGFMEGIEKEVKTIAIPTSIVIDAKLPDDVAYKLAKALVEGADDIQVAVPAWDNIKPHNVCKGLPIDIHPGAVKYYKEIGCLK